MSFWKWLEKINLFGIPRTVIGENIEDLYRMYINDYEVGDAVKKYKA